MIPHNQAVDLGTLNLIIVTLILTYKFLRLVGTLL
jgi:hypothetical protein